MCNKSACWNSRPHTGKSGPSQTRVAFQTKEVALSQLGLECTTLNLTILPQYILEAQTSTKPQNRAELAVVIAPLINEHTYIATNSAGAPWQIRNSILYPQHMRRHKHAKLLETIVHHIQLTKDIIHLCKVKAHAGIQWNKCADSVASCPVEYRKGNDIHVNLAAHPHSSIFWPAKVKAVIPAWLPDITKQTNYCKLVTTAYTDSMIKGGGYVHARTRQPQTTHERKHYCGSGGLYAVAYRSTPWLLLFKLYSSAYLVLLSVDAFLMEYSFTLSGF